LTRRITAQLHLLSSDAMQHADISTHHVQRMQATPNGVRAHYPCMQTASLHPFIYASQLMHLAAEIRTHAGSTVCVSGSTQLPSTLKCLSSAVLHILLCTVPIASSSLANSTPLLALLTFPIHRNATRCTRPHHLTTRGATLFRPFSSTGILVSLVALSANLRHTSRTSLRMQRRAVGVYQLRGFSFAGDGHLYPLHFDSKRFIRLRASLFGLASGMRGSCLLVP
jgi:hypothetical protein